MSRRIEVVDGLRGIAVFMVIYQHVYSRAVLELAPPYAFSRGLVASTGWQGVNLFFILSGFVLALPYLSAQRSMFSPRDAVWFLKHRAKRLIPVFTLCSVAGYIIQLSATANANIFDLLLTLSTMTMFSEHYWFPPVNGVFWSMMLELWFSAAFPILLWFTARYGFKSTFAVGMLLSLLVRIAAANYEWSNPVINPLKDSLLGRVDDFLVGFLIARLYSTGRLPSLNAWWALGGVTLIVIAAILWELRIRGLIGDVAAATIHNVTQLGFFLVVISALNAGFVNRLLSAWLLRVAGAMCFSLYAWHVLLIGPLVRDHPFSFWANVNYWIGLLIVAGATYRFVEFPRLSWRRIFLLKPSAQAMLRPAVTPGNH